jgi:hypothetical protein
MPPSGLSSILGTFPGALLDTRHLNTTSPVTVSDYLAAQWENPSDILAILLLWGPETIQGAVAALAGRTIAPVAFSFGWAAYAARALTSVMGKILTLFLFSTL